MSVSDALSGLSLLFLACAKTQHGSAQEYQGMRLDQHVLFCPNAIQTHDDVKSYLDTADAEELLGSRATNRATIGMTLRRMLRYSTAKILSMENGGLAERFDDVESEVDAVVGRSRKFLMPSSNHLGTIPAAEAALTPTDILLPTDDAVVYHARTQVPNMATRLKEDRAGQIHLVQGNGMLHGEQHLLVALSHRLYAGKVPKGDVYIGGVKPPCASCRKVLDAVAPAYEEVYGQKMIYSKAKGQNRDVAKVDLSQLVNHGADRKFQQFVAAVGRI